MSLFPCQSVTSLVKQLHARDSRRRFCADEHWLSPRAAVSHETLKISVLLDGDEDNESEGTYLLLLLLRNYKFTGHLWPLRIARITILNKSFVLPCYVNSFLENGNGRRADDISFCHAMSIRFFKTAMDGELTTSRGSSFQCFILR